MTQRTRDYLKGLWIDGYKPNQTAYADKFDSFFNVLDNNALTYVSIAGSGGKVLADNGVYVDKNAHTHSISAISTLQTILDTKATITSLTTTASELQTQINGKQPIGDYATNTALTNVDNDLQGQIDSLVIGANDNQNVKKVINLAHSFSVGDVVTSTSDIAFSLATASTFDGSNSIGIVSEVSSSTQFTITMFGYITGLTGLTQAKIHYLSTDVASAGRLTTVAPSSIGEFLKPVLYADTTTSGYVLNYNTTEILGDISEIINMIEDLELQIAGKQDRFIPIGYVGVGSDRQYLTVNEAVSAGNYSVFLQADEVHQLQGDLIFNSGSSATTIKTPSGSGGVIINDSQTNILISILGQDLRSTVLDTNGYSVIFEDSDVAIPSDLTYSFALNSNVLTFPLSADLESIVASGTESKYHFAINPAGRSYQVISVDFIGDSNKYIYLAENNNEEAIVNALFNTTTIERSFTNIKIEDVHIQNNSGSATPLILNDIKLIDLNINKVVNNMSTGNFVENIYGYNWNINRYYETSYASINGLNLAPYSIVDNSMVSSITIEAPMTFINTSVSAMVDVGAKKYIDFVNCMFPVMDATTDYLENTSPIDGITYAELFRFTNCTDINGTVNSGGSGQSTGSTLWTMQTSADANFTADVGSKYMVDTSLNTASITATIPASAVIGSTIDISDMKGNFGIPNKNVITNTILFEGVSQQFDMNVSGASITLVYTGSTYGWKSIIVKP